jgi:hypothetical protein
MKTTLSFPAPSGMMNRAPYYNLPHAAPTAGLFDGFPWMANLASNRERLGSPEEPLTLAGELIAFTDAMIDLAGALQAAGDEALPLAVEVLGLAERVGALADQALDSAKELLGSSNELSGSYNQVLGSSNQVLGSSKEVLGSYNQLFGSSRERAKRGLEPKHGEAHGKPCSSLDGNRHPKRTRAGRRVVATPQGPGHAFRGRPPLPCAL